MIKAWRNFARETIVGGAGIQSGGRNSSCVNDNFHTVGFGMIECGPDHLLQKTGQDSKPGSGGAKLRSAHGSEDCSRSGEYPGEIVCRPQRTLYYKNEDTA